MSQSGKKVFLSFHFIYLFDFFQASPRLQTVRLKVGGRATLYKGTKVKIRCPVKGFDRWVITYFYILSLYPFLLFSIPSAHQVHTVGIAWKPFRALKVTPIQ